MFLSIFNTEKKKLTLSFRLDTLKSKLLTETLVNTGPGLRFNERPVHFYEYEFNSARTNDSVRNAIREGVPL